MPPPQKKTSEQQKQKQIPWNAKVTTTTTKQNVNRMVFEIVFLSEGLTCHKI